MSRSHPLAGERPPPSAVFSLSILSAPFRAVSMIHNPSMDRLRSRVSALSPPRLDDRAGMLPFLHRVASEEVCRARGCE